MSDVAPPRGRLKAGPFLVIRGKVACLTCLMMASSALVGWHFWRPPPEALARKARQALERGDLDGAERLIGRALGRAPLSGEVLVAAAEVAVRRGDALRGIDCYQIGRASCRGGGYA